MYGRYSKSEAIYSAQNSSLTQYFSRSQLKSAGDKSVYVGSIFVCSGLTTFYNNYHG